MFRRKNLRLRQLGERGSGTGGGGGGGGGGAFSRDCRSGQPDVKVPLSREERAVANARSFVFFGKTVVWGDAQRYKVNCTQHRKKKKYPSKMRFRFRPSLFLHSPFAEFPDEAWQVLVYKLWPVLSPKRKARKLVRKVVDLTFRCPVPPPAAFFTLAVQSCTKVHCHERAVGFQVFFCHHHTLEPLPSPHRHHTASL